MPCSGSGDRGRSLSYAPWENWARTKRYSVPETIAPSTLPELVAAVEAAERSGGVLKAAGSGWSYSDAAVTREVTTLIDTSALDRILDGGGEGGEGRPVIPFALRDDPGVPADRLVHVEAGIKIWDLNCRLHGRTPRLAMPTLGGSNGQSLAGVISTATHGADVNRPPIHEAVRAIHLVGPGGVEWWVERAGDRAITDASRMEQLREEGVLCADLQLRYDDELFAAVLVSLGRMGVIYAVVLEADYAYKLRERTDADTWSTLAPQLQTELVDEPGDYERSDFLEVVINPYANADGDHDCVVTRRWRVDASTESTPGPGFDPFDLVCRAEDLRPALVAFSLALPAIIGAVAAAAAATVAWIPFIGAALVPGVVAAATSALVALQVVVARALAPRGDLGSMLVEIMNLAVKAGQKQLVRDLTGVLMGQQRPAGTTRVDWSFVISTGQPECPQQREQPACLRVVDGVEYAFDATPGHRELFDFLERVFGLTSEFYAANRPVGFGISLRFTRGSEALLAMQRFARTCHVEFVFVRGLASHPEFLRRLHRLAREFGGVPHWGLLHELNGAEVSRLYGDDHTRWRHRLAELLSPEIPGVAARTRTFSTSFSVTRNLEPLRGCTVPPALVELFVSLLVALRRFGMRDPDRDVRG